MTRKELAVLKRQYTKEIYDVETALGETLLETRAWYRKMSALHEITNDIDFEADLTDKDALDCLFDVYIDAQMSLYPIEYIDRTRTETHLILNVFFWDYGRKHTHELRVPLSEIATHTYHATVDEQIEILKSFAHTISGGHITWDVNTLNLHKV